MTTPTNELISGITIQTRFLSPTDTRGSRISAVCKRGSDQTFRKTISWNHGLGPTDNHRAAAEAVMAVIETELAFTDCEPLRIVAYGAGGSDLNSYFWLANRGDS